MRPGGEDGFLVARPAYGAHHTFIVISDRPGGRIEAIFSYTDEGPALSLNTPLVVAPPGHETYEKDVAAWGELGNSEDTNGVIAISIDASDSDIITAGTAANDALGTAGEPGDKPMDYDLNPSAGDGCNSNCAPFAIANVATERSGNGGEQPAPSGTSPIGSEQAARVEELLRRRLP